MYPSSQVFSYRLVDLDDQVRVEFEGEFDAAAVLDLDESGFSPPTDRAILIDLRAIELLDSTAIGFLHRWWEKADAMGVTFQVVIADPLIEELFRITGLTDRLSVTMDQ